MVNEKVFVMYQIESETQAKDPYEMNAFYLPVHNERCEILLQDILVFFRSIGLIDSTGGRGSLPLPETALQYFIYTAHASTIVDGKRTDSTYLLKGQGDVVPICPLYGSIRLTLRPVGAPMVIPARDIPTYQHISRLDSYGTAQRTSDAMQDTEAFTAAFVAPARSSSASKTPGSIDITRATRFLSC